MKFDFTAELRCLPNSPKIWLLSQLWFYECWHLCLTRAPVNLVTVIVDRLNVSCCEWDVFSCRFVAVVILSLTGRWPARIQLQLLSQASTEEPGRWLWFHRPGPGKIKFCQIFSRHRRSQSWSRVTPSSGLYLACWRAQSRTTTMGMKQCVSFSHR